MAGRTAVIGGGAAGMAAAYAAACSGEQVVLFEQNEKLGKKLYITGKGRCNLTNAGGRDAFFSHVLKNPKFLYSAWAAMDSASWMEQIETEGVPLKVERGDRVFPQSDKSSDIIRALERMLRRAGVMIRLNTKVRDILTEGGRISGICTEQGNLPFDRVIVATGGCSYPSTGSTGDGYRFAEATGHRVTERVPSLVPLITKETWPGSLAGVTLKNVRLLADISGKRSESEPGELLFTHTGISGPLALSLSGLICEHPEGTRIWIDLKPGLTPEQLDARLLRDLESESRKKVGGALHALLPARLLSMVFSISGIDPEIPVPEFTRAMRLRLRDTLKAVPLTIRSVGGFSEAIITRGGVDVRDLFAKTMESRIVPGLFFAGEVLDVDATTGGYNLQIAWSTGTLAGRSS